MKNQYERAQSHPYREEEHNEIGNCIETNNADIVGTDEAYGGTIVEHDVGTDAETDVETFTEQTLIDYSKPLLTHDQLQRELSYRISMSVLDKLRDAGLITAKEFVIIAPKLEKRFSPVWGSLYQYIA